MAYNRTFNPDALPKFAEPERKQPNPTTTTATAEYPPRGPSANQNQNRTLQNNPPNNQPYGNKPPPPLPRQEPRSNSYGGSGQGRQTPQDGLRSNSYGSSGQGRQPSPGPIMQIPSNYGYASSPPSHNGRFPSPNPGHPNQSHPQQGQYRPPPVSRHPPSPTPGGGIVDPSLMPLFRAVDKNGSGQLSEQQLGAALVNGDWTSFDPHTIRLMIRMFDTDGSGTIGFEEFCGLWSFLASWRTLFDRFDTDRSGNISLDEFTNALTAFGYRLSPEFVRFLFGQYDKYRTNQLSFDLFVQACISLKRMTDVFKRYDDDRDGFIQLSFEEFLTEILRQR